MELNSLSSLRSLTPTVPLLNNLLYAHILRLIQDIGVETDTGGKLRNSFCFGIANWLLIRRIVDRDKRFVTPAPIALICFFPIIAYSAYVMPEAAYFAEFVVFCQRLFSDIDPCSPRQLLPGVVLLAALCLHKTACNTTFSITRRRDEYLWRALGSR